MTPIQSHVAELTAELLLALIGWMEAVNGPGNSEVQAKSDALRAALAGNPRKAR